MFNVILKIKDKKIFIVSDTICEIAFDYKYRTNLQTYPRIDKTELENMCFRIYVFIRQSELPTD